MIVLPEDFARDIFMIILYRSYTICVNRSVYGRLQFDVYAASKRKNSVNEDVSKYPDKSAFLYTPFTRVNHGLRNKNIKIYIAYSCKPAYLLALTESSVQTPQKAFRTKKEHKTV